MKKVVAIIFYFLLFLESLIFFIPKDRLFLYLEDRVKQSFVDISQNSIEDKGFLTLAKDVKVNYDKLDIASLKSLKLYTFLFYNSLRAENIELKDSVSIMMPKRVDFIKVSYLIFNPLYIHIYAKGDFGEADGFIDILHKKLSILVKPSKLFNSYHQTLSQMKKEKSGYRFEYRF